MTRDISGTNITASSADLVRPVYFVDLDYDSGPVRTHNGTGTITWGGNDFLGVGDFGGVSDIEEDSELSISKITLTLSGIDPNNISIALSEKYQGRAGKIYKGYLDENHQLIADPLLIFSGRMDIQEIELDKQAIIKVSIINRLADWDKTRERRYNNDDQQAEYSGDKGMEFVARSVEKQIFWGKETP
jgi:hypothetical protein